MPAVTICSDFGVQEIKVCHCFIIPHLFAMKMVSSSIPWFMDLTFQVTIHNCFLQYWALLSPPDTSTSGHCFRFDSASSFFLELILCSSSAAYWVPTDLWSSSFCVISFCFPIQFMGFSRQECNVVFLFLSQWTTLYRNSPPWLSILGGLQIYIDLFF